MAVKYHISPTTGRPNKCTASKRDCPVGGDHYPTPEAAREAYEAQRDSFLKSHRKAPAATYDTYDQPLRGTGTGPGGREATRHRLGSRPQLAYEETLVGGDRMFLVTANGEAVFTASSFREFETAQRAVEAGAWPALRELLSHDQRGAQEVEDSLYYRPDDLDEELEAAEEALASLSSASHRERDRAHYDCQVLRVALAIRDHENSSA